MELYIPARAKTQTEIFNGFGKKEIQKSVVGITFGAVIATVAFLFTREVAVAIIIMIAVALICGVMCAKIESIGQSIVDIFIDLVRFKRSQKIYPYRYLDEWGEQQCRD